MSGFRTKLDFSDNRQAKQRPVTRTVLSGGTSFGIPFDLIPTGPNLTTSAITSSQSYIASTFSGDNTSTVYSWADARMQLGITALSALTSTTSGLTQNTGAIWTSDSTTIIDGNTVALTYSGVSFDISVVTIAQLTPTTYSGTITTNTFQVYSATSLDYTGRTIWVDVSGITRTEKLIISDNPQVGYVWTCIDSEGMGGWMSVSGSSSGTTIWTAGTGAYSAVLGGSNGVASGYTSVSEGYNTIASGNYSHAEGYETRANGLYSHAEGYYSNAIGKGSHAEGGFLNPPFIFSGGTATGNASHAEGRETKALGEASHAEGLTTIAIGLASHAEGWATSATTNYSHAEGVLTLSNGASSHAENQLTIASGDYSHAEGYKTTASGTSAHSEGRQTEAGDYSHAEGYGTIAIKTSHARGYFTKALNDYSVSSGFLTEATGQYSFVHGANSYATNTNTVVFGSSITGTLANTVYVPDLVIDGLTSTNPIATDLNGKIVAGTSDARLKQNIQDLNNSLNIIKNLRGVSFEYTPESNMGGGIRYGFIAQEVQEFVPDIVRCRAKDNDMLSLNYDEIVPILVEAVKELSTGITTSNNTHLETQTVLAEDNNIELNYNGTQETSLGGGLKVLHAKGQDLSADLITDGNGDFITNNDFKPNALTIPLYTPTSSNDVNGNVGNLTRDDNYLYVKTSTGWKRTNLENF